MAVRRPRRPVTRARHVDPAAPGLGRLFLDFLRIGATAFGGFMALIAVVENTIVERRRLLKHEDMLNGISLATMLPGPVAVNVCAYVGYRLRGGLGALVCATGVILPAFLLILALSIVYFAWGEMPAVSRLFMGFVPAVAAIILVTAWNLGRKAVSGAKEAVLLIAAIAIMLGVGGIASTLVVVLGAALMGALLWPAEKKAAAPRPARKRRLLSANPAVFAALPMFAFEPTLLLKLFVTFAGMSLMLFGGGYVFIPLIQEIVVKGQGWVTDREFIDAIALGQVTPGPILISATFIGYKVAGLLGALVATVAIFAPPALLMVSATRLFDRLRASLLAQAMLRGVRAAVIGMIVAAVVTVAQGAAVHWVSVLIFVAAAIAMLRKIDVVWIIPAAGALGWLLY